MQQKPSWFGRRQSGSSLNFTNLSEIPPRSSRCMTSFRLAKGTFLSNMKNSLNGLRFGFGIPKEQIKVVGALHGPANMLNYDDYVWNKYRIGEVLNVINPATAKAPVSNIVYSIKD